jgi:hypothetical protein
MWIWAGLPVGRFNSDYLICNLSNEGDHLAAYSVTTASSLTVLDNESTSIPSSDGVAQFRVWLISTAEFCTIAIHASNTLIRLVSDGRILFAYPQPGSSQLTQGIGH